MTKKHFIEKVNKSEVPCCVNTECNDVLGEGFVYLVGRWRNRMRTIVLYRPRNHNNIFVKLNSAYDKYYAWLQEIKGEKHA